MLWVVSGYVVGGCCVVGGVCLCCRWLLSVVGCVWLRCRWLLCCRFLPEGLLSVYPCCRAYYGLPEGFPVEQMLTRTKTGKKKNLYLTSRLVKALTLRNEHVLKVCLLNMPPSPPASR